MENLYQNIIYPIVHYLIFMSSKKVDPPCITLYKLVKILIDTHDPPYSHYTSKSPKQILYKDFLYVEDTSDIFLGPQVNQDQIYQN
jgi:hypothetical protein